jgi:hypothetical protein
MLSLTQSAFSSGRHDRPLPLPLFIGAQVKSRILLWALTAGVFILTLAFSSWHEGLWRSDAARATRAAPQRPEDSFVPTGAVAEVMTTPTAAAAPAAAPSPPPAIAPPEPVQSEPNPDVDGATLARRDRGAEHGSRSH